MSEIKNITFSILNGSYVDKIADIHMITLKEDVLPALGKSFLKFYYSHIVKTRSHIIIGAFINHEMIGFCQLSFQPMSVFKIIFDKPILILLLIKSAFIHPVLFLIGLVDSIDRNFSPLYSIPEIAFIAIKPIYQKFGYGTMFVRYANKIIAEKGYSKVITKTSNFNAKKMYEKNFNAKVERKKKILTRGYWYLSWAPNRD